MARGPFAPFLHYLHARQRSADADAALLARYVADCDEAAFAELVRRHGALVWQVCLQVLGHDHDADDAFQATFVLLARRARSVRDGAAVAGWLHGTAWRVAQKARAAAAVRRKRERQASVREPADAAAEIALRELQALVHEEVARLPAKYRAPFVLCVLEGRSRAAVAKSLRLNEGTLSTQLAWARQRLRKRLARRGVDVAAALCVVELARGAAPAALVKATAAAVVGGSVSPAVGALITGGIGTVLTTKVQQMTALGLLVAALTAGTAGLRGVGSAPQPPAKAKATPAVAAPAQPTPAPQQLTCPFTVTGTATGPDSKPVKGATVALTAGTEEVLRTTTTDAQGRYEIRDVPLPVSSPNGDTSALQVGATAPDLTFAWSPVFLVYARPDPRFADRRFAAVARSVDLTFGPTSEVQGSVLDEHGQPVVGAKVELLYIDVLEEKADAEDSTCFMALHAVVPEKQRTTTTDRNGRFHLGNVPRACFTVLAVSHPRFTEVWLYAATSPPPLPDTSWILVGPTPGPQNPVWTGEIDVRLVTPRSMSLQVMSDLTGEPVAGCVVEFESQGRVRPKATGETDAQGRLSAKLPPGEFSIDVLAPAKDYVMFQGKLTVVAESQEQPLTTVRLVPGCVLRFEAVDADSGRPLGRIEFQQDADGKPGEWVPVQSATGVGSYPAVTDDNGKLRVTVSPGKRRIAVKTRDYDTVKSPTEPVELPAGQEVKLRFELRKKGQDPAPPPAPAQADAQRKTFPFTVSGTGPDGKPVPGATIAIVLYDGPRTRVGATTATDAQGRYEFRDTTLMVFPDTHFGQQIDPEAEMVTVQVLATAPGLPFEWSRTFMAEVESVSGTPRTTGSKKVVDVAFRSAAHLQGRIVDERGQAVVGASIGFGSITTLPPSYAWLTNFRNLLPRECYRTTTDREGRFRLDNLPRDCFVELSMSHPDFATVSLYAATTTGPLPDLSQMTDYPPPGPQNPVWTGDIDLILARPREVPVQIVSDRTGEPIAGSNVGFENQGKVRVWSGTKTTDAQGKVSVRLPPGGYSSRVSMQEKGFLFFQGQLRVAPEPQQQSPYTIRLVPGCMLHLELVDADSGRPVDGAVFQQEVDGKPGEWEEITASVTGERGKFRSIVPPGKRRICIKSDDYDTVKGPTEPVELPVGGEVKLRFELRKKGQAAAPPAALGQPPAPQPATVPVTVSGTATGPDGKPVKGATVNLLAVDAERPRVVATAIADEKGAYHFSGTPVPLPAEGADAKSPEYVTMQVCATAPGLALAWSPRMYLYSNFPPAPQRNRIPLNFHVVSEPQRADLTLGPPEPLTGRVVDEQGRPVSGAKVRLGRVDPFDTKWLSSQLTLPNLPAAPLTATTGPDGRFHLAAVPHGFGVGLTVAHPDFADTSLRAATVTYDEVNRVGVHGFIGPDYGFWLGEIRVALVRPRSVPVRVVSDKTGQPLRDVEMVLYSEPPGDKISISGGGTTRADGRAAFHLPPGRYHFLARAPHGTNYLQFSETVTVAATPDEQARTIRLVSPGTVDIEAVDADTGRPVPGVRFEQGPAEPTRPPVQTGPGTFTLTVVPWQPIDDLSTGFSPDAPGKATDRQGRLTSLVFPGTWLIRPRAPFVLVGEIKPVELPAGETVKLRILVRK